MKTRERWVVRGTVIAVATCCLLTSTTVDAQSKKSARQAESLERAGDRAKSAVQDVLDHLGKMLAGYNSIIEGDVQNTQSVYKKLVGDLKTTDKKIEVARKQLAGLDKEADKFFADWEQDLSSIQNESVREKSAKRLESARQRFASVGKTLARARDEFAPVVQELSDQIIFLGRDLSPEAVADLQDEAEELNRQAEEVTARVKAMLQSAGETQDQAQVDLEEGQ